MRLLLISLTVVAVFGVVTIARLPMSLVTDRVPGPVVFQGVSGSIWNGKVEGISVQGVSYGDAAVTTKLLPLLKGQLWAEVAVDGKAVTGAGAIGFADGAVIAEDALGKLHLARFSVLDAFGQKLRGDVDLTIRRLEFSPFDGCREADLSARTDALTQSLGVYAGRGFEMTGDGYCDGQILVIPLEGEGPEATIRAELRLDKTGQYVSKLTVTPVSSELGSFLRSMGFSQDGDAYTAQRAGRMETAF